MLSEADFNLLVYLKDSKGSCTQRSIAKELNLSLGKVNNIIKKLAAQQLICVDDLSYRITKNGLAALEPYKVKNAIIMAAGMSSRFVPLSFEKPKGLLNVKGELLIEREICQLQNVGITDITVVVGYMKEKFFYLEDKYGVKIVVNEDYYRYNNTSTLMKVLNQLSNTFICSSDNYFVENVFEPYVYRSYYAAVYATGKTDEYCIETNSHGRIKKVTIGGENCWYMLGHAYFDHSFSDRFKEILVKEYSSAETKEHLWENLYMRYIDSLEMYIKKYDADKLFEFDSLEELRLFDQNYINNADSRILHNICGVLQCEMKDIVDFQAIKAGLTNASFRFRVDNKSYVYRHPGEGTDKYINRKSEAFSMKKALEMGLDNTFIYIDEKEGWKISQYIENVKELDYTNMSQVSTALKMMKKLHERRITSPYDFDIWKKTQNFIRELEKNGKSKYDGFSELYQIMTLVEKNVKNDGISVKCLCHNDCYSPNFLLDEMDNMYLIDWEYSGNDDPASDLGTFICCSHYDYNEAVEIIKMYLQKNEISIQELRHYIGYVALASYYWFVWALYQDSKGNMVGEWLYIWYKNSKKFAEKALKLYQE